MNSLSKCLYIASDVLNDKLEEDIDDFINLQLGAIQIAPIWVGDILLDDALISLSEE